MAQLGGMGCSSRPIRSRKHRFGSVLVLLVVLLYVCSGVAIQLLFEELNYEKPFLFSYISVALCSSYLLNSSIASCRYTVIPPKPLHIYRNLKFKHPDPPAHHPRQLLRPALLLAPSYFCLNYTYFLSLDLTTVSSTMILSASTGVWTLLFSCLLLKQKTTRLKLVTVLISVSGMSLVTYSAHAYRGGRDAKESGLVPYGSGPAFSYTGYSGDLLALMSAAASGVYMVLLRVCVPENDPVHIPSLFGMIGCVCSVCTLPIFPLLHYAGVETFELPSTHTATLALLLNAATSTVLPDMLLAQAVVMTSPLVATLGLSLMIPLSVVADHIRGFARLSPQVPRLSIRHRCPTHSPPTIPCNPPLPTSAVASASRHGS